MINPGGTVSTSFNKSATTRFNNNQIDAAKRSMPYAGIAQQALRRQSSAGAKKSSGAVGPQFNPNELSSMGPLQAPAPAQLPTGGPQAPPQAAEGFDAGAFQQEGIDRIVGSIRTEQFLNSPQIQSAAASVRLKNFMNHENPTASADPRNLLEQVISRTGY